MTNFGNEFETFSSSNPSNPSSSNTSSRSSSSRNTSTTTRHTLPGVFENPLQKERDLQAIAQQYNQVLGPMNMQIARYIERLMLDGMEADVILDALQSTAWARRPSPQYFRAICARYHERGILTMGALLRDQDEWECKRKPWWVSDEQDMPF